MDIQTKSTTVVQTRVTVSFDSEQEARDVLVDPAPFQRELRRQLGKGHKPNWNTGLGKPARVEKKPAEFAVRSAGKRSRS